MINILIRTHKRPEHFKRCIESIKKQTYKNYKIHVVTDDMESLDYCREYNAIYVNPIESGHKPNDRLNGCLYFPQNRYIHELYKNVKTGYVMGLDDDDELAQPYSLEHIRNAFNIAPVVFWRVNIGGVLIPSNQNWKKHPVVKDMSGIGYAYHNKLKEFLLWNEWKQADYRNAATLYDISEVTWLDEVLTKTQSTNHCGATIEEFKSKRKKDIALTNGIKSTIYVIIPVWKRNETWNKCAAMLKNSINEASLKHKLDIRVLTIVSPEDNEMKKNILTAQRNGFLAVEYSNNPLGRKLNAAINFLLKENYEFNYLMTFGSDNVLLPKFWEAANEAIEIESKFFGSNGFTCIDQKKKQAIKMQFPETAAGAGRFIHKDILIRSLQRGTLYPKDEESGLDSFSQKRIYEKTAESPYLLNLSDYILDIKTKDNINDFDIYAFSSLSTPANYDEIIKMFGI
jgi:glycosyltransferase involved in cell wall biosynthesis